MDLILVKEVKNKGKVGDTITVSRGYAMNFLIPKGFAIAATQASTQQFKELKKKEELRLAEEKKSASDLLKTVSGASVSLSAKANEEKLYGSIPPNSIAKQLNTDLNTSITKDQIIIETPIKTIGEHDVTVQLHPEVQAKIKVVITAEEEVEIEVTESAEEAAE